MLPPSEGKTAPPSGPKLALSQLSLNALTTQREEVLGNLLKLCAGPKAEAMKGLSISNRLEAEVDRNAQLHSQPCAPAIEVYTGVLFKELSAVLDDPASRQRANQRFLIASALWGAVAPEDLIPAYRLSIGSSLPGLPGLAGYWRAALTEALPINGFLVDLRSGAYAAAWPATNWEVVEVGAAKAMPDGSRKTISHMAKAARGRVAALLARVPKAPRDAQAAAEVVATGGEEVELTVSAKTGHHQLTVIET